MLYGGGHVGGRLPRSASATSLSWRLPSGPFPCEALTDYSKPFFLAWLRQPWALPLIHWPKDLQSIFLRIERLNVRSTSSVSLRLPCWWVVCALRSSSYNYTHLSPDYWAALCVQSWPEYKPVVEPFPPILLAYHVTFWFHSSLDPSICPIVENGLPHVKVLP